MQAIFLTIIVMLVCVIIHQEIELRELERKTLDAFRIVCSKIKPQKEDK